MSYQLIVVALLVCLILVFILWFKALKKNKAFELRYSKIIDVDHEVAERNKNIKELDGEIQKLRISYAQKREVYEKLKTEASIYDDQIQLAEQGLYQPIFDFDTSEKFKDKIKEVREQQKEMVRSKVAVTCSKEWQVDGSTAKGRKLTNQNIKMASRAFNNECEAAIGKVSWSNVHLMWTRIEKAFEAINKLNESNAVVIDRKYLKLKLDELTLTYEYMDKKQKEKQEQAEIRQQMREEAKLEKEFEQAKKEEEKYQSLLKKAQNEAQKSTGDKLDRLQEKIRDLNDQLIAAHEKSERAKSMAEQTKIGHVYVISNKGSFGDNVYKIGMTRRLEPLDRVKELGDASVPFLFDVHAMIYSEDAPNLERELHKTFDSNRLNLVNNRKEFFNLELDEIEREVLNINPEAEFIKTAEAREYQESMAIRSRKEKQQLHRVSEDLPETI